MHTVNSTQRETERKKRIPSQSVATYQGAGLSIVGGGPFMGKSKI
jgi:hypothetical protein